MNMPTSLMGSVLVPLLLETLQPIAYPPTLGRRRWLCRVLVSNPEDLSATLLNTFGQGQITGEIGLHGNMGKPPALLPEPTWLHQRRDH